METDENDSGNVVVLATKPSATDRLNDAKWGRAVMALGFCVVPSLLLVAQARLKISSIELALLLQLADHWWQANNLPYPSKRRLSERMDISLRQVQRHMASLESKGLIKRVVRRSARKGQTSNHYDLGGLVKRLKEMEPNFTAQRKEAAAARTKLVRPGLKRRVASNAP